MKKLIIAAGLLAITAGAASAQRPDWQRNDWQRHEWHKDRHPYARQHHNACQEKAHRLHGFERRAKSDGRLSWRERMIMRSLVRDLDRTCGRFRWRG